MKKFFVFAALAVLPFTAYSATNAHCWKGTSQKEQDQNLETCKKEKQPGQSCSTNAWVHEQGVYDVCLRTADHTLQVVSCAKGYSGKEQLQNLKECQAKITGEQVCETNAFVHGHAVFDVCIMQ